MPNRNKDFNELLAKKMMNIKFSQMYLMHLVNDENQSLKDALIQSIVAMGLKPFCSKAHVSITHISDFIHGRKNISEEKLTQYIQKVFKLKTRVVLENPKSKAA